ncbi:MAG: ATP:cob(I)alamin adenosyltransferase [Elusimicrobiota bacterium]
MTKFKPVMGRGDTGMTDLPTGKRVKKTDKRIKALGLIDELGALLGLVKVKLSGKKGAAEFHRMQQALLTVGSHAAGINFAAKLKTETAYLETRIDKLSSAAKPPLKFILPGRTETEVLIHLARTKARSCEISLWETNSAPAAVYLNRLSDYLFLLAGEK